MNTLQKPFSEPKGMRQAINHAINRDALAQVAFNGYAKPATGVVPASIEFAQKYTPAARTPAHRRANCLRRPATPTVSRRRCGAVMPAHHDEQGHPVRQQQLAQVGIKVSGRRRTPVSASSGYRA